MKNRIGNRVVGKVLAAAVGAVGIAGIGQQADASLVIDMQAVAGSATGGAVINNTKSVTFSAVGQSVVLNLVAQIRGTNSVAEETIQSSQGSATTVGSLLGNLSFGGTRDDAQGAFDSNSPGNTVNSNLIDPMDALASSDGQFVDLDSDGDIDVGSTGNDPALYFVARAPSSVAGTNVGNGSPNAGDNRNIGRVKFTYTGGDGTSLANFIVRTDGGNPYFSAAVWAEDGAGKTPTTSSYAAGSPVNLFAPPVPEPTGLALAAVSSIGLLARRRNRSV
jgi:hypothetical protein